MSRTLTDGVRRCSAVERQGRAESGFAGSACVPPAGAEKGCERMRIWKVVPAAPEHISDLAAGMREADRREVWASHRHTPVQALENSLSCSDLAWTCLVENAGVSRDASSGFASGSGAGPKSPAPSPESSPSSPDAKLPHFQAMRPAFMWGVCRLGSILSDRGSPWLLGTDAIRLVHREFLRQCPDYVARMQERFPRLENVVHAENRISIRWLRWCGFTVDDAPVLINDEPFFVFWKHGRQEGGLALSFPCLASPESVVSGSRLKLPALAGECRAGCGPIFRFWRHGRQEGGLALSCAEGDGLQGRLCRPRQTSPRASVAQDVRPSVI